MAKLTRLTHKIAIKLHLMAESCTVCSSSPGGRSENFWIRSRMLDFYSPNAYHTSVFWRLWRQIFKCSLNVQRNKKIIL